MTMKKSLSLVIFASLVLLGSPPASSAKPLSDEEAQQIAKEAYIYGYPMVDHYKVMFVYYLYSNNPEYKGSLNAVYNTARVYTPDDKTVQTPNSDTTANTVPSTR